MPRRDEELDQREMLLAIEQTYLPERLKRNISAVISACNITVKTAKSFRAGRVRKDVFSFKAFLHFALLPYYAPFILLCYGLTVGYIRFS